MITITIPNNNINERKYIIDIIFNEFLGLKYKLEIGSRNYEILFGNKQVLTIKDTFFNNYPKNLEYLKLEYIPKNIDELDVFASAFFMLTRWEEYVNKIRDSHGRFPVSESLAFKEGFIDRPIVNENIDKLKLILFKLDNTLIFKEHKYKLFLTHDIDSLLKYENFMSGFREIIGDIIKRKNISLAFKNIILKFKFHLKLIKDPADTFDWIMDCSEAIGIKDRFYFMSGGVTSYDNRYKINSDKALELIKKIKERGHIIGIHPSYNAFNDTVQFTKELNILEKIVNQKITEGREHYLRFEIPYTWQIWNDNNMKVDSTCGYSEREGFRCGVCYEYSTFNILTRQKLILKEKPLIVMEGSLRSNNLISEKEMENKIIKLLKIVKKYNGEFVFLWHNCSFNTPYWSKYQYIYKKILDEYNTIRNNEI